MSTLERTRVGFWRDELLRDVLSMAVAMAVVGASLGAIAVSKGVPLWMITLMGAVVFAGGSEFMVVGLAAAGAAPVTAVLGGLMLNARHLPFGVAVGGLLDRGWPSRLIGSHLMVDESVAFALAQDTATEKKRAYWLTGIALYTAWAPSVFLGGLLGQGVGDPGAFGLDAAMPAALLALIMPSLREFRTLRAVAVGALVAVLTTPLLPEGLPVMAGLVGLAAALPLPKRLAGEAVR
ncbi:AzlC family ABC transporter permease [Saccharopolyspora sp. ASAGF58]|uniref:AzlC family ABC transporter permease n=1 Tax=Saccharopolyspora sp. ASAGF58 TaxID=2719023 RepID=UPI00143FCC3E|nr:AzlC family ABC transporter permease [Saccharopolyspora sp. ASAGF58]QIZ33897.1 branched-chain amino acid ABC transporter permease [Saccharopolyspora sp. ASAGF58]